MATVDRYRIVYWVGGKPDLSTKMRSGKAEIDDARLQINGEDKFDIPLKEIADLRQYRLQGSMRMISLCWRQQTIHLTVVRINIAGYLVIVNALSASRLFKRLEAGTAVGF